MVRLGLIADDDLSDDELEEEILTEEKMKQKSTIGIIRLSAPRAEIDDEDVEDEDVSHRSEERLTYSPGGFFSSGDFSVDHSGRGSRRRENMGLSAQMGIESPNFGTRLALSPQAGFSSPSSGGRRRQRTRSSPLSTIGGIPTNVSNIPSTQKKKSLSTTSRKSPSSLVQQQRQGKRGRRSSALARERSRRVLPGVVLGSQDLIECTKLLNAAHIALGAKPKSLSAHNRDYGFVFGPSFRCSISATGCVASASGNKIKLRRIRFTQVPSAPFELLATVFGPSYQQFLHLVLPSDSRQLKALTERFAKLPMYQNTRLALIWDLVMALWFSALDDTESGTKNSLQSTSPQSTVDRRAACARDRRFEAVSAWFAQRVKDTSMDQNDQQAVLNALHTQNIFEFLCQRRVDEAAKACASVGKTRLALLVASSADPAAKYSLGLELERLEQNTTDAESALLARVVGACAGRLELEDELGRLEAQLPWPKRFGLHLWYERKPGEALSAALRSYDLAVSTGAAEAPTNARLETSFPIPAQESEGKTFSSEAAAEYRLMQLSCALGGNTFADDYPCEILDDVLPHLLTPFAFGRCAGDAAFAWPLLLILEAAQRGVGPIADVRDLLAQLADTLIFQLLCEKRIAEALFVISVSFPLENQRSRLARQLLDRFPDFDESDIMNRDDQKIILAAARPPSAWIHAARALDLGQRGDWPAQTTALLKAQHFNAAHESLLRNAATSRALFTNANKLRPLLEALATDYFERPGTIQEEHEAWNHGAGFFLDYLRFLDQLDEKARNHRSDRDTLSQLQAACSELKRRITTFPQRSATAFPSNPPPRSIGASNGLVAAGSNPIHLEAASKQHIYSDISATKLVIAKSLDASIGAGPRDLLEELSHADNVLAPSTRRDILDDLAADLLDGGSS